MRSLPTAERFWPKVIKTDGCWLWKAGKRVKGYGSIREQRGRYLLAHRYSYELHNGPIPVGMCVCHACDNPSCVNPDHLWLGTNNQNVRDSVLKHRRANMAGERNPRCKISPEKAKQIRKLYASKRAKGPEISQMFNLALSQVYRIIKGTGWTIKGETNGI